MVEMVAPSHIAGRTLAALNIRARFGVYIMAIRSAGRMIVAPGGGTTSSTKAMLWW